MQLSKCTAATHFCVCHIADNTSQQQQKRRHYRNSEAATVLKYTENLACRKPSYFHINTSHHCPPNIVHCFQYTYKQMSGNSLFVQKRGKKEKNVAIFSLLHLSPVSSFTSSVTLIVLLPHQLQFDPASLVLTSALSSVNFLIYLSSIWINSAPLLDRLLHQKLQNNP